MTQDEWLSANTSHCRRLDARISPARCRDIRGLHSAYDAYSRAGCASCPQADEMDRLAGFAPTQKPSRRKPPVFFEAKDLPEKKDQCSVAGCAKPPRAGGMCWAHYGNKRYHEKKMAEGKKTTKYRSNENG